MLMIRRIAALIAGCALLVCAEVSAGSISFQLSVTGSALTLTAL
jgi:hypothetical protein